MSLLQRALDRAENKETQTPVKASPAPETPVKTAEVTAPSKHEETSKAPAVPEEAPRLKSIRYYEKQNKIVEKAIREELKKEAVNNLSHEVILGQEEKRKAHKNFLFLILALLAVSLLAWKLMPSAEDSAESRMLAPAPPAEKPSSVVIRAQTPVTARPVSQVKFSLTGITVSGDTNLAVINNQVVGTGDQLREGAFVKSITASLVVLEMDGRQIVLEF